MKPRKIPWFLTLCLVVVASVSTPNRFWKSSNVLADSQQDKAALNEGIRRIQAFDEAVKSGDRQKIQQCAHLIRANPYAVELIKNRPQLKLQLDKIPRIATPPVSGQTKSVKGLASGYGLASKAQSPTPPPVNADALEALPPDAPKGKNVFGYEEIFGDDGTAASSSAPKKQSAPKAPAKPKVSSGPSSGGKSSSGSVTQADPKLSKNPSGYHSGDQVQSGAVSTKHGTVSGHAPATGQIESSRPGGSTGSSASPKTGVDQNMANRQIEYQSVDKIKSVPASEGSSPGPIKAPASNGSFPPKPKGIKISTQTWNDLYDNIVERRESHYANRKILNEAETAELYKQMDKRNAPRKTYSPYAKGKKPAVTPESSWSDINRAANYDAATDLKKGAKFSKNPNLSTLADPDSAYLHPDSVRDQNLKGLRRNQAEALTNLKNEFRARTKGMDPGSTQYKEQRTIYDQKKTAIEKTFKSHDRRGEYFTKLQKKYPNIKATGSPPKNVRADVDIATDTMDDAMKIKREWQADGDDVLTYRDKKGRPYKIVNRTKDTTMWTPETVAGREAKIGDLDAFTTTGGQKATGNINQPSSHTGFNLDNQKKLRHALEANDWKTAAKSIDKAGREVGLHKKNPDFYKKLEKLRNYGDGVQAGIYNTNDPPGVQQQKMRDFFKTKGAAEMTKAAQRARELDVYKKSARTELSKQMRQSGHHDIADRITGRMNQVDVSNQQATDFLKTGKAKTGHKMLTEGKSSFAREEGLVSKIKTNIAEARELNRLAESAKKLADFDKGRIIEEARLKHGDEFARKLTKKMTPRKAMEFGKKLAGKTLDGTMAAGMLADGIQKQREKLAKEDKDFGSIYSLDGIYEGTKNVGHSLENIGRGIGHSTLVSPYEMGKKTALAEIEKLPEYEKQVRKELTENGILEGMSKDKQDELVRNIARQRAHGVASAKAVGKQVKGFLWDPFYNTSNSNLEAEALKEYRAAKAAGEDEDGLLDDGLSTGRSLDYRYRALTKTAGDLSMMNRVFDTYHYDSEADRQAWKMERKVTDYTKKNLLKGLRETTRLREQIEKLTATGIPKDPESQERLRRLQEEYDKALNKVQRVDALMKDKVDAKDKYVKTLQEATRQIPEDPMPYGTMLKGTYNELEKLSRTGDHGDPATRARIQTLLSKYAGQYSQIQRQRGTVSNALSPSEMLEYANLMAKQQREQLDATSTGENDTDDDTKSTEPPSQSLGDDENPLLTDTFAKSRYELLTSRGSSREEGRRLQEYADQDSDFVREGGKTVTDDELQSTLDDVVETLAARDRRVGRSSKSVRTEIHCTYDGDCPDGYICFGGHCLKQANPVNCSRDTDCPTGFSCKNGDCVPSGCGKNRDCPEGYACRNGECIPSRPEEVASACSKNADCPKGYACRNSQCVKLRPDKVPNTCKKNADCPEGYACRGGQCVGLKAAKVPSGCAKNADCPEGYACRSGQCVKLRPDKAPNSCGKNADCPEGYACRSGQCVKLRPDKVPNSCSKNADCPERYACRNSQCVKLRPDQVPDSCWKNADCPEGYACRDNKCISLRAKKKAPDSCSRDNDCPGDKICIGGKCVEAPCTPDYGCCNEKPVVCMGYCWPKGTDCCGNSICRPGTYCCQDNCCNMGEVCCDDGGCCPPGTYCCVQDGMNKCCRSNF